MGQAQATITIRQPIEHPPTVSAWFTTTQTLFNAVAAFYWQVLDAHPGLLELSSKDALTALERLTLTTASSPAPVMPLSKVSGQVPALFQRAAIHAALGSRYSFRTHQARRQRAKAKAEANKKPPECIPRGVSQQMSRCRVKLYPARLARVRVYYQEAAREIWSLSP